MFIQSFIQQMLPEHLLLVLETQWWEGPRSGPPGVFGLVFCYHMDTLCPAAYLHRFLGPTDRCACWFPQPSSVLCLCKYLLFSVQISSAVYNSWLWRHTLTGQSKLGMRQWLESRALKLMSVCFFPQNSSFCF